MLDSLGIGGWLDPLGMAAEAGVCVGSLVHLLLLHFRSHWGCFFLSAPLLLSDSGPAPLVCTA